MFSMSKIWEILFTGPLSVNFKFTMLLKYQIPSGVDFTSSLQLSTSIRQMVILVRRTVTYIRFVREL